MAALDPRRPRRRRAKRPPRAALHYSLTTERESWFGSSRPWGVGDTIGLLFIAIFLYLFLGLGHT